MNTNSKTELEKIEETGDLLIAEGVESERGAEESNEFERRIMGIPGRECKNCGEEYLRGQKRCGLCGEKL